MEYVKIGDVADVTKLAGYEFTEHVVYSDTGKIIGIRGLNVKNGSLDLSDVKYLDNSNLTKLNRSKLYTGDIVYTYVGTIGNAAIIQENDKYYLAPNVCLLRPTKVYSKYLFQILNSEFYLNKVVLQNMQTSSQPALSMDTIKNLKIPFHTDDEQQKIGKLLTSIDELIEIKIKELSAFKYKFKYYKNIIYKLRIDESDHLTQYIKKNSEKNSNSLHSYCYSISNKDGFVSQDIQFESRKISSEDLRNYYVVRPDAIAYNPSRIDVGSIGLLKRNKIGLISPLYVSFYAIDELCDTSYIFNWLNSSTFKTQISRLFEGSVRNTLSWDSLKDIKISIHSKEEQSVIVKLWELIENKIILTEKEIEQYTLLKKYYLNKLFK